MDYSAEDSGAGVAAVGPAVSCRGWVWRAIADAAGSRGRARHVRGQSWARIEKDFCLTPQQVRYRLNQAKVMLVQFTLREMGHGEIAGMLD